MKIDDIYSLMEKTNEIQKTVFNISNKSLKKYDLTFSLAKLLMRIGSYNYGVNQQQLALALRIHTSAVVIKTDKLAKKGLIIKRNDEEDRRAKIIQITPYGNALLVLISKEITELEIRLASHVENYSREILNIISINKHT
ncbi:MarR family winged helix-turn-helix transcriptional regulator [Citrobacter amalonaticus]|uniref:MarR family winged helix-turn-helix transcriptional regulator n=1 Tax=Citrobacter amalonaticus TaxID=35703 RepID=UPI0019078A63|nr:MarR family transcriptional regulator [Citrobacter amalonaticus]MBJ9863598.1 MarR family transcriptional regulator [Citrobacter amalonaticus]